MTNEERLADALAVFTRMRPVEGAEPFSDDEAVRIYDQVVAEDLPRLNGYLKAVRLAVVEPRAPRDASNPPSASMRLFLLTLDLASQFEKLERRVNSASPA